MAHTLFIGAFTWLCLAGAFYVFWVICLGGGADSRGRYR